MGIWTVPAEDAASSTVDSLVAKVWAATLTDAIWQPLWLHSVAIVFVSIDSWQSTAS
jgi:hypothetical protein